MIKRLNSEKKIIQWIILLPIFGIILTSFILTNILINSKYESHKLEIEVLKQNHITSLKGKIKERIEHIYLLLDNSYNKDLEKSKKSVKDIVDVGHETLSNIYQENKTLSKKQLYKIIDERMRSLRFFENKSGYYFIYDLKDGISISLPSAPFLVGKSLKKLVDKNGKNLFDSYGKILDEKGEGYDTWFWNKPNSKEKLEKIGYIKKFEPLNIGIGTAVYVDDLKQEISKNAINFINQLHYDDDGYIFVIDKKGKPLVHINKEIVNIPLNQLSKKTQENVSNIITKAKRSNGSFIEYTQAKKIFTKKLNSFKKISYVKHNKLLDWVIGTGLYTDKLNEQISKKRVQLKEKLQDDILSIVLLSLTVTAVVIFLVILLSKKVKKVFRFYSDSLEHNNKELHRLNKELSRKVDVQVTKLRDKDIVLNQQAKLAALGEMLGNIAHQWRQPLSAISTLASGTRIQKDMNMLNDKQLDANLESIVESTKILSNTIDDFKNFYSKDKDKHVFTVEHAISKVLSLISANIKHSEIELILDIKDISIVNYENELIQALLNLVNNAKDALEDKTYQKFIFISSYAKKKNLVIEVYDNAGGIEQSIIDRIFEPYFTTKHQSRGTGIGLYMTKNIIESSLKGHINVQNRTFTFKEKEHVGALFTIEIPLK